MKHTKLFLYVGLFFLLFSSFTLKNQSLQANQTILEKVNLDCFRKSIAVSFPMGCVNMTVTIYANAQNNFTGCLLTSICGTGCLGSACIWQTVCVNNRSSNSSEPITVTLEELEYTDSNWKNYFAENNGVKIVKENIERGLNSGEIINDGN